MGILKPFSAFAALLLASSPWAAEPAATLTLEEALASVEKVNVSVLLSRETAAQSLEVANQQRASTLPLLDASVVQRRSQGVSIATVVVTSGRPASRFDALLTGSYPLLNMQRRSALRGARAGAEVAQANYQAIVQDVLADVAQTYFTHLRNLRRLDVLDANIARARSLHELARNQLNAGVATQIDVTRAEAQVAQAEQARLQQVTTLYRSELLLKRLLDLAPGGELRLADFQVRRTEGNLFTFSDEKTAFEKRANYLAVQKALEQTRIDVRTATFERLPSLALTGQFGYASPKFDDSKQDQWSTGVGLSVPVFDGLRTGANRRIALSRQRAQEMRLHNLELQISSELRLAVQDAGSRNAQIEVAGKNLRLAQEELRLAQQRYRQGVADNREVVEAQNRLAIADDNYVEAVYQYNLSRMELARARGDVRAVLAEKVP
ncbi:MAG: TolC family protein [Verrucomicrobia bacterium]|nr:TolC family protein [Verrucomicrobiota bacterium]